MENPCAILNLLLFLLTISAASTSTVTITNTSSVTISQELESTLQVLRTYGYTLFPNAITTSDIQFQLLTTASSDSTSQFTIFAPRDAPIYQLDMAADASAYVSTLRYHVIPGRRLTFADLQSLSTPYLDTLLPHYSVLIGKTLEDGVSDGSTAGVLVDGARVSDPDLFLGSRIAVHGIDGILVTSLNVHHLDVDSGSNNGSDPLSPAASPAPVSDVNLKTPGKENLGSNPPSPTESPAPVSDVNLKAPGKKNRRSDPPSPAESPGLNVNIPAVEAPGPSPLSQAESIVPVSGFNSNIPAKKTLKSRPLSPAESPVPISGLNQNIPVEEALSPTFGQFDRNYVPAAPAPKSHGNIPMKSPSAMSPAGANKVKSLGKKKHQHKRRHGRRHGLHRHHQDL